MKHWKRLVFATATVAGLLAAPAGSAQASAGFVPNLIHSGVNGLCLDADGSRGGVYSGDRVQLWSCDNADSFQEWLFLPDGTIHPWSDTSYCLDAAMPYGRLTAGASVQVFPCNGGANQVWTQSGSYFYNEAPSTSGQLMYLDAIGSGPIRPGTGVEVWNFNGGSNQQWY